MKLKFVFVLALVGILLLSSCAPVAGSQAVQLPEQLVALIGMLMTMVMTQLAKLVFDKFGIDIQGESAKIAASLSAVVVLFINYLIGLVPAAYDNWISALFAFLIILLGAVGFYSLFIRRKSQA